jgi:hypothetical protein
VRTVRFLESKEPKCQCEVSKALLNVLHKAGYLEVIYSEFLEVHECGEVTQGGTVKLFRSELGREITVEVDTESLDERKQTKLIQILEWCRPQIFPVLLGKGMVVSCEGVVKMGYGSGVP